MKLQNAIAAAMMMSAPFLASAESYSRMDNPQDPVVVVYKVIGSEDGQASSAASYNWKTIRVDAGELDETIKRLEQDATVGNIQISGKVQPIDPVNEELAPSRVRASSVHQGVYNDPFLSDQVVWEEYEESTPGKLSIALGQQVFDTSKAMRVGVIDGGFVETNEVTYESGANMVLGDRSSDFRELATCGFRHGTQAAHLIAAYANDGIGMAGIVKSDIVAARVFEPIDPSNCDTESDFSANSTDVADAVLYLSGEPVSGVSETLAEPVDVINMSLSGGGACPEFFQDAINVARSKGVIVVGAAGNTGSTGADASGRFPANCEGVVTVGSNDFDGERSNFSNYGEDVDIYATGRGLFTVRDPGVYTFVTGTSFAAPIVAAHAALIKAVEPEADDRRIARLLTATKKPLVLRDGGVDTAGRGIMNSLALAQAVAGDTFVAEPLSHALINEDRPNAAAYTQDAANLDTCNLYDVDTTKLNVDRPAGSEFRVLEVADGSDFTVANGTVIATSQGSRVLLKGIDPSANDYGLSVCGVRTGTCDSSIPINLNAAEAFTQTFCPAT